MFDHDRLDQFDYQAQLEADEEEQRRLEELMEQKLAQACNLEVGTYLFLTDPHPTWRN